MTTMICENEGCGGLFEPYRSRGGRRQRFCSERCKNVVDAREWRERNPEAAAKHWKRAGLKRFGWTLEDFEAALVGQEGRCAICGTETKLVADHDHETGVRRELLCDPCNKGLGSFGDDPDRLVAAATYVIQHRELSQAKGSPTRKEEAEADA